MVLGWIRIRWAASSRPLTAVFLGSILAISLAHAYLNTPLLRSRSSGTLFQFDLNLEHQVPESAEQQDQLPLGEHTLTSDGLLIVNPSGPHPIYQLIRNAEAAWKEKVARSSKTLDEAVAEYRRRYRRAPPLGFDKWWDYVIKHDVQLPDEYDEIFEDLEPFWGIDPRELARTQEELEKSQDVVTIHKADAHSGFDIVHSTLPQGRQHLLASVHDIFNIVREVEQDLPPLRIVLSPFDNPQMLSDWQIKSMALDAAANGTTLTRADLPPVTQGGWVQACPPDSPARISPSNFSSLPTAPALASSLPKTFIASHRDTMDPCAHPSLLTTHGQFLAYKQGPNPEPTLVPRFSLCATMLHHDIRPPVPYGWDFESDSNSDQRSSEDLEDGAFQGDVPWERKVDERLGWRGRTTGMWASPKTPWVNGHRARLVTLANALEGNVSVLHIPENADKDGEKAIPVGEPETLRRARINPAWMDIAFTEGPIGCDKDEGTCEAMEKLWEFRRIQQRREEGRYKFILDVDGNGWSGRFKRLMTSNALIFKATIYPEWFTSRIAPWVHYVPIQVSYVDLYDAVAFFRVHDELAARIAKAGQDWSRRFWRREDMTAYLYRLLLEYARVSSLDRTSMDYVG